MKLESKRITSLAIPQLWSLAAPLLKQIGKRFGAARSSRPRLELVERIVLAPRQSLALVEAEGRLLLVATSAEGGPAFYPLDPGARRPAEGRASQRASQTASQTASRISW